MTPICLSPARQAASRADHRPPAPPRSLLQADSLVVEPVVLDGAAMVGKQRQQQQLDDEEAVMVGRLVKALGPRRRAAAGPAEAGGAPARPHEELARIFALARGLIEQEGTASFGRDTSRRLAMLVRGEGLRSSSRHSALSASSAAGSPA